MAADDLQSKAADLVKKMLTVGVGAIFMTEESVRAMVSDFKLPKEMLGGVLDSAGKTKKEFLSGLSKEIMARVSDKLDPGALLQDLLEKNEITIKISVKPKAPGAAAGPSVRFANAGLGAGAAGGGESDEEVDRAAADESAGD